jgi:hypothetical protein
MTRLDIAGHNIVKELMSRLLLLKFREIGSWLTTMVAIGLWKPYANSESGTNLVMFDVY